MRTCPNCTNLTAHDAAVCSTCLYHDDAWASQIVQIAQQGNARRLRHEAGIPLPLFTEHKRLEPYVYTVRLSAYSDSSDLGFHYERIKKLLYQQLGKTVVVRCDGSSWAYDWDYAGVYDPQHDLYLPPSLPLPALIEATRFIHALRALHSSDLQIEMLLPEKEHAATRFIEEAELFAAATDVSYLEQDLGLTHREGGDDVFIPLTAVGPGTDGQLPARFHEGFTRLAAAGLIQQKQRSDLRRVVMEAAENADIWGEAGWVACFLRQEKRGRAGFGHRKVSFDPARVTHLFLHVFTVGPSLAEVTGIDTEWNAAAAVLQSYSVRTSGGGSGFPVILKTVNTASQGTLFVRTGNYTRIHTPDGLAREFRTSGTDYLPGVHLAAVIPLVAVSDIARAGTAVARS